MNKSLTIDTCPRLACPIVLRLAMPVRYDHRTLLEATRSSVYRASGPVVRETSSTYFDKRIIPTRWPDAVLDESVRNAIWELCATHRDRFPVAETC
ncbi:hypothetical protein [Sciscionella marina]|uniref:hypothetical protein n=1 Tax=Sciscionella marina TaxID=508770 RepID=UPI00037F344C|nr:hypothetical protein [Sciscionella marina]